MGSFDTTITLPLASRVKAKLDRLAEITHRGDARLAAEAIAEYVDRELDIIEGIERGLSDVEAGRVVPHDEAMARIDNLIEQAGRNGR